MAIAWRDKDDLSEGGLWDWRSTIVHEGVKNIGKGSQRPGGAIVSNYLDSVGTREEIMESLGSQFG